LTLESLILQLSDEASRKAHNDDNLQIGFNHNNHKILNAWEC